MAEQKSQKSVPGRFTESTNKSRLAQQRMRAAFQANDDQLVRHPNSIFTSKKIQEWLNSPTGNWFKRLFFSLLSTYLAHQQLKEIALAVPAKMRDSGGSKPKKSKQTHGDEASGNSSGKDRMVELVEWLKNLFADAYNELSKLSQSLNDAINTFDQKISKLLTPKRLSALRDTFWDLDKKPFEQAVREQYASKLKSGEMQEDELKRVVDQVYWKHASIAVNLKNLSFKLNGFVEALFEKFKDVESISSEDACRAFVDHQLTSLAPGLESRDTPGYKLLQGGIVKGLHKSHGETFKVIMAEYNNTRRLAKEIDQKWIEINDNLKAQLAHAEPEVARNAGSERMQTVMNAWRDASYAGSPAPRPSQSAGRRREDEEPSYTSPNPLRTHPTPPGGGSGSAGR